MKCKILKIQDVNGHFFLGWVDADIEKLKEMSEVVMDYLSSLSEGKIADDGDLIEMLGLHGYKMIVVGDIEDYKISAFGVVQNE